LTVDNPESRLVTERPPSIVYFDGSCPLCRAEIGMYSRNDSDGALCFVDISARSASVPAGLTQQRALQRFHVRNEKGQLLSGAAAFVEVWDRLPGWRWAARMAKFPGAMAMLELGYRLFLPIRPFLSRFFRQIEQLRSQGDGAKRR
jgi:predicted DCC family thiol-disulfide oxidoreductase YuxK